MECEIAFFFHVVPLTFKKKPLAPFFLTIVILMKMQNSKKKKENSSSDKFDKNNKEIGLEVDFISKTLQQ